MGPNVAATVPLEFGSMVLGFAAAGRHWAAVDD